MKIKTKFNIGDKVFYFENEELKSDVIDFIAVCVDPSGKKIQYALLNTNEKKAESKLYASKEDFLDYVKKL